MKKKGANKRGVSLIVLTVTVIIMAILATTAIATLDDSDVIEFSKGAVKASNKEAVTERLDNLKNTFIVDNFGNISAKDFVQLLLNEGEIEYIPTTNADGSYTVKTISNYTVNIEQDGDSNLIITVE